MINMSYKTVATAALLAHMRSHKRRWRNAQLARDLAVHPEEMRVLLDALIAAGDVCVDVERERWYYLAEQVGQFVKPTPAAVTPSPYVNIWTKPLQGYDARMQTAMTMRSA
jgi:hypothetical protein